MLEPKKPTEGLPELQELNLISNKISTDGIDIILESLALTTNLRHLTLQNICCAPYQFEELFRFIKRNQTLISLDLSWNKLAAPIIQKHLYPALEKNKTLEYLNLSHIKMSSPTLTTAFRKFSKFVKENDRLLHLNLSSVDLLPELMLDLITHIKRSISLHCVHLCGNRLDRRSKLLLLTKLKPYLVRQKAQEAAALGGGAHESLLREVAKLREAYQERHQKIYEAAKIKEIMSQWLTVQKSYDKQPATTRLSLQPEDHEIEMMPTSGRGFRMSSYLSSRKSS